MSGQDPRDPGHGPDLTGRSPDDEPAPGEPAPGDQPAPGAVGPYGQPPPSGQGRLGQYGQTPPYGRGQPGQYGQQWETGPAHPPQTDTGRRTGLFLLLGGGLVLVALIGFLAYSLLGNKGGTDTPEHAVQAFGDAIENRDCPAAQDVMTDKAAGSFSCGQVDFASVPDIQVSLDNIRVIDQSDARATVKADLSAIGQSVEITFSVVNQSGDWLIDNLAVNAAGLHGALSGR